MNQIDKHEYWLTDIEQRVRRLENLHTLSNASMEQPDKEITLVREKEWTPRQWDAVKQIRSLVLHLQKKLNEHTDKQRPKGKY